MAKRFPVPEFDYEDLRGRAYEAPPRLATAAADEAAAARRVGAFVVAAPEALARRFSFSGDHLAAVLCVPPEGGATMVGRSHAWYVQRALAVDSLDGQAALHDWTTPRPMNTRLGPDEGVRVDGPVYLLLGHRLGDGWVANRVVCDDGWQPDSGEGFRVVSADRDDMDDFHAAIVSFTWG